MTNLTTYPLEDGFETTLAQSWNGGTGTVYLNTAPSFTFPSGVKTYIVVNPGKTNMQVGRIDSINVGNKTVNVDSITIEKGAGVNYSAQIHAVGSKVIISDNYQFWKDIATAINSKADSASPVFTGSVTVPEYVDATARDAAIPTPTDGMIVQTGGIYQGYNAGTAQWESFDIGTPPPDASTTVKGLVQEATDAQVGASTATGSTGAKLFINPASVVKTSSGAADENKLVALNAQGQVAAGFINNASILAEGVEALVDKDTFFLGEDGDAGDSVFAEDMVTFASADQVQAIGDSAGNTRVSIPAFGSGTASNTLKLALRKYVSPGVDLGVRIETDNAGQPSGTLIDPNAEATITEASLTTSLVDTTISMAGATDVNEHGVTLDNTEATQTSYKGLKFTLTSQVGMVAVTKDSDCTATHAYLYDEGGNLLDSEAFAGQEATFNYTGLVNGQSYYILAGSGGASYTSVKQTGAASFPYVESRLDFTDGGLRVDITDAHGAAITYLTSSSDYRGVRLYANKKILITGANKNGDVNATTARLLTDAGGLLESVSFSGDVATFSGIEIPAGTYFRMEYGSAGSTSHRRVVGPSFPYNQTNINFVGGSENGSNNANLWDVVSVRSVEYQPQVDTNIHNITKLETTDAVLIPEGQRCHIVLYPGTYGSETINATNYFGVGYATIDTTTRRAKTFNGTVWSAGQATRFYYTDSNLFTDKLLSLTDATYSYKLPTDLPRVLTESKTAGQYAIATTLGLNRNFTGLTPNVDMYLADTPGAISSTPGTNFYQIGTAIASSTLNIKPFLLGYGTGTVVAKSDALVSTNSLSYIKLKEINCSNKFTYNVYFEISRSGFGNPVSARVYVNGVAVGTVRTINDPTPVGYSEFISVNAGDLLQIYGISTNAGTWCEVRNFRIGGTIIQTPLNTVII